MAAVYPLLLFVLEVLVDDFLQAGAVRLDVALQLRVVQGTDLIFVKLLVKLHTHTQDVNNIRTGDEVMNKDITVFRGV